LVHLSDAQNRQNQSLWLGGSGITVSTSNKSNIPESYVIVPNGIELDQGVLRIERVPDTVQTGHVDWGFRFTPMYGIDYRWTTSQGGLVVGY